MFITRPGRLVRRHVAGETYKEQQQQRSDDDSLQGKKKEKRNQDYSFDSSFITAGFLHYSHNPPRNVKQKKNCLTKKLPKAELKMAAACTNTHSVYHFGDTAGLI